MTIIDYTETTNTFDFNGHQLRTVVIEGEPWFVAADVCRCIYPNFKPATGVRSYMNGIDSTERRNLTRESYQALFEGTRGGGRINVISESAVYKIVSRANTSNPEAVTFQKWVFGAVLPSIRKTGGYLLNEDARSTAHADNLTAMPMMEKLFEQITAMMAEQAHSETQANRALCN